MNTRSFLTVSLLTVLLLVSCAPAESPAPAQTEAPAQPAAPMTEEPVVPPTPTLPAADASPEEAEMSATEAPTEDPPLPVPTSRGPDLEATDPATVSLASGDLQLVEFFRYT